MAKKSQAKKNWSKTNGSRLATEIENVGNMMKGNADFEKPAVDPDAMITQSGLINTAYNNRKNGLVGREKYKTVLAETSTMMNNQAEYVSQIADGNTEIIASAGFTPTATSGSRKTVPQSPAPPVLTNSNGGLHIKAKPVKGASSYCYVFFINELSDVAITDNQIMINPKASVMMIPAGNTREFVRGLASGTKVFAMALAQNSAGKSAFSPVVSICVA